MKLANTTDWTDEYLINMVRWCCTRIGLGVNELGTVAFVKADHAMSGVACGRDVEMRLGEESKFPCDCWYHGVEYRLETRDEGLVYVTAHELQHVLQLVEGDEPYEPSIHEPECVNVGMGVMRMFRGCRRKIEAQWGVKCKPLKVTLDELLTVMRRGEPREVEYAGMLMKVNC